MVVFLCYCLALYDFMFIPPSGASTDLNLNTVTAIDVWKMAKGRAFVLTCWRKELTLKEIEQVLGKPRGMGGNLRHVEYWYQNLDLVLSVDIKSDQMRIISCEVFRIEHFNRGKVEESK